MKTFSIHKHLDNIVEQEVTYKIEAESLDEAIALLNQSFKERDWHRYYYDTETLSPQREESVYYYFEGKEIEGVIE